MAVRTWAVAFAGVEAKRVEVQVQIAGGVAGLVIVGLADKAVNESRDRVRAAFASIGLALPGDRIIVNLAPADMPKEGAHFDLPIALALLAEMGVAPRDAIEDLVSFGELGLDGALAPTPGVLPAAMAANAMGLQFLCAESSGAEAAWSGGDVIVARTLIAIVNHFKGNARLKAPQAGPLAAAPPVPDLRDVKGQEQAKRALEIAAAGGHNLLFVGPPGSGKSMLAQRLPGLLPPLTAEELLDVSMVQSIAGLLQKGELTRARPFRAPHHSASMAALVGGGIRARPGEVSLAHRGVLFLDEIAEFAPATLDALRQPLETGDVVIARANHRVTYPARFQLVAAMNPCRCGGGSISSCRRWPRCAMEYQSRLSGPFLDRIDLQLDVPPVTPADLALPPPHEGTAEAAARVLSARALQQERTGATLNAALDQGQLETLAKPDEGGAALLSKAAETLRLSARAYHRCLKVARTIADMEGGGGVRRVHLAEALSFRRIPVSAGSATVS
jgi:magnesium chelatase family protein